MVRTHVVATTACTTGGAHTHLSHAHFSAHSACTVTFAHLHACHIHAFLKGAKKVHCTCVISLSPSRLLLLMIDPSLLFLDGHFETNPDYDFTEDPIHTILPYFPVLKAQDMRHSAPASRSLATWSDQMQTHFFHCSKSCSSPKACAASV